jgi:hypothetical protein
MQLTNKTLHVHTLAQKGTAPAQNEMLVIHGKESDLSNNKALRGRAKRKLITQKMTANLMDVAKEKGDLKRAQSYRNAYYCQNRVLTATRAIRLITQKYRKRSLRVTCE